MRFQYTKIYFIWCTCIACLLISACVPTAQRYGVRQNVGLPMPPQAWLIKQKLHAFNRGQSDQNASNSFYPKLIAVSLVEGTAQMKRSHLNEPFASQSIHLRLNACDIMALVSANKEDKSWLKLCYIDGLLYVDGSDWQANNRDNALRIHASPLWGAGFSYAGLSSIGNTHLSGATLNVKQVHNNLT